MLVLVLVLTRTVFVSPLDIHPRGIVLIAPFSSILSIARTYALFGLVPLLRPLLAFPGAFEIITKFLVDKLDTLARLSVRMLSLSCPPWVLAARTSS